MRGRLLQHLQQGVGRYHVQRMRRIQQRHAPAAPVRGGVEPRFERADLVDADVLGRRALGRRATGTGLGLLGAFGLVGALFQRDRLRTDAPQIRMVAAGHPGAGRALAARQALARRLAQQAGRRGRRKVQLADAAIAMDQPGMREAVAPAQPGAGDLRLPGQEATEAHAACATSSRTSLSSCARTTSSGRLESMMRIRPSELRARSW
ncbi:Uncharacterised protein [Bordetella pertussis]|nr:Uncharacterised protein [Bordetella pertussis]CFM99351.1 Uncharacterised protein [Bordetella pertussis]CFN41057.1 Uncharacterised protein [Bordetella pertussis]CFO00176.1 Uncharacterised protein [Bordetella pertussis]CFP14900.1 Uncharacterised protein [Bordetella pertussis]